MVILRKFFSQVRSILSKVKRNLIRKRFFNYFIHQPIPYQLNINSKKILIIGIYLTDYPNMAAHLVNQYNKSQRHQVDQKWIAIGKTGVSSDMRNITCLHIEEKTPKFKILNQLLENVNFEQYDYIIFSDDDIAIQDQFIDVYVDVIEKYELKLAQPARASHSYNVHSIVLENKSCIARETNFVEIGPIFSFHKSIFSYLLPFPHDAAMGFGLDYIWPVIANKHNFKIGIVDIVPVDHSYRMQSKTYSSNENMENMYLFLEKNSNNMSEPKINSAKILRK